jgi:hypothetical protein
MANPHLQSNPSQEEEPLVSLTARLKTRNLLISRLLRSVVRIRFADHSCLRCRVTALRRQTQRIPRNSRLVCVILWSREFGVSSLTNLYNSWRPVQVFGGLAWPISWGLFQAIVISDAFMVSEELTLSSRISRSLPSVKLCQDINGGLDELPKSVVEFARNVILTVLSDIVHLSRKVSSLQQPTFLNP